MSLLKEIAIAYKEQIMNLSLNKQKRLTKGIADEEFSFLKMIAAAAIGK